MKDKKDISDLIRDNKHKLEERPSTRTWERLEGKLDNRRSRGNTFLYRQIAMAAAVIALVAVISLITVLSDQQNAQFAKADEAFPVENWIVQDLETVYTDATTNLQLVVEFQKQLKERYANPIQEGTQAKKLLASNKTFTGRVNSPDGLEKEILARKEKKKMENDILPDNIASTEATTGTIETTPKDATFFKNKNTRAKNEEYSLESYLTTTQQMEWMLGEWKEGNSILEWQKVNKSTILCDEFILKDKRNSGLHFIDAKSQQSYTLISDEDDKKVFSNKNSDQIILEKINPDKFTITFLPNQGVKKIRFFTK
jgi:hypothetical protein